MKKMRKTLLLALSFVLVAVVSVTSTLAYLSAQDSSTSVWTSGKVDIELKEQQRNENGTALEEFQQGKDLLPLVGSAQGEKDEFGLPVANNYVDKIVTVENTGRNDAYVRVLIGIPVALDDGVSADVPLHWNLGNRFNAEGKYLENPVSVYNWTYNMIAEKVSIDGIQYNIWNFTYNTALTNGEETPDPAIIGFYLDSSVNYDADRDVYTFKGEDITGFDGNVIIPVIAQGVQADGFATSAEAFEAAFPVNSENLTTWFNELGVTVSEPAPEAVRPAGILVETNTVNGVTVIDGSDENTNLRALYTGDGKKIAGDLTITDSYLDGTYAMNVIGDDTGVLTVTNTDLRGWVSYDGFTTATFTNCTFGQNTNPGIYNVVRPYSKVTFVNCDFDGTTFYFDKLEGATVTFENCTMNGEKIDSIEDINVAYGTLGTDYQVIFN